MMNARDNSLRLYNRTVLHKTRMHAYTKRYIDNRFHNVIYKIPKVDLVLWSLEDLAEFQMGKHLEKLDIAEPRVRKQPPTNEPQENDPQKNELQRNESEKNEYEPVEKKQKLNDENGKTILKLVLSREGETDTFKSQFKTALMNVVENAKKSNCKKNDKKNNKKSDKNIERTNNKNIEKNNGAMSTNNTYEIIDLDKPLKAKELTKSSNLQSPKIGNIRIRNFRTDLIEPSKFDQFCACFEFGKSKASKEKKPAVNNSTIPNTQFLQTKNLLLSEIECLYQKYFTKTVQDHIVVIANILNIISMSNKHHKARMDESFKKKTEAEKLKERCDANRMHLRHKKVLESKLKKYFVDVISEFFYTEFEPAFQMFFLSILTVLRVLDQPKFKKGSIFKNLVLLLWNSLKNSELEHAKVFAMFRSKTFRPDCIDLISLIEDSRDCDPGITDRMSLFFVSSVNSQEYFQTVIDAVTSDSNEDLALLIEKAASQCCINSRLGSTETPSLPTTKKNENNKISVVSVPSTSINEDSVQRWVLAKTPSGTFQPINVTDSKFKKNASSTLEPGRASQQLNSFYESFSNSLSRGSASTSKPKIIVPKGSVTSLPSTSNGSIQSNPTFVTFKPTIQSIKPITSAHMSKPTEGNTFFVGNKQYHVIRAPVNSLRASTSQNNNNTTTQTFTPISTVRIPDVDVRCYGKNCQNAATIMCSTCRSVKYCSHNCQRLDWYETHINDCERLNATRID